MMKTVVRFDLVEQLKQAIQESGESLTQLGLRSGVSPSMLSRFTRGRRDFTLAVAARVARALGLELSRR
jgi:transcriptional regulator with XRE-family HTH domain